MGDIPFTLDDYMKARHEYGVAHDSGVTERAERQARKTGCLSSIVDPAVNPLRRSLIRLNPHGKKWISTVGCPMDIEVSCDTTGSMGGEVDKEMAILPELYESIAKVLPGYDPQLCLGIFGDLCDKFSLCRPEFEMEARKIVNYLKEMAPQRDGGDPEEDPQYAMFARAYLTDAYTNRIGLKGYHFIVTDSTCHDRLIRRDIKRIFGDEIFDNELKDMKKIPSVEEMIQDLKKVAHQFVLVIKHRFVADFWRDLCGEGSVIEINSTDQLPAVISAIVGLTEGTIDVADLEKHLKGAYAGHNMIAQLSSIDIGAQARLRHALPYPVPKAGDVFAKKGDIWPIQPDDFLEDEEFTEAVDRIEYL